MAANMSAPVYECHSRTRVGFIVRRCFGVSRRRTFATIVRSIGRDPHSTHLLPKGGYTRARNVCGLLDAGVVVMSDERLRLADSRHALMWMSVAMGREMSRHR
jgi:hypothetical protein